MLDCVFCKIVEKRIPAHIVHETDDVLAFKDINPQAPVHILVIPKKHIDSLSAVQDADRGMIAQLLKVIADIAEKHGVDKDGYRVVTNCGERAGQSVKHLHFHLLAGRDFTWPPG